MPSGQRIMRLGRYGHNSMDPLQIYKNKTVLVTGHTGFKGSWLSIWLKELKANVIGFSLKEWNNDYVFKNARLNERVIDERGDVTDYDRLSQVFLRYKPEIIFHLAAQPLVRESYIDPVKTFSVNMIGTVNVLECIRKFDCVKSGIIITTDKCYKNKEQKEGYKETDELGGDDPYSTSKAAAELTIESYRKSFFASLGKLVASARAGNSIGGGDFSKDRLIPDCVSALKNNRPIKLRNCMSVRPWQHVLEPIYGYLLLGVRLSNDEKEFAQAWNFGPEKESIISVAGIADLVIKNWEEGEWQDIHDPGDLRESKFLTLDISKTKERLKWKPRWNIEKAIEKTISWYKNVNEYNTYKLCSQQINEYLNDK